MSQLIRGVLNPNPSYGPSRWPFRLSWAKYCHPATPLSRRNSGFCPGASGHASRVTRWRARRHSGAIGSGDDRLPPGLFSVQTGRQLGREIGTDLDVRRFRANIYMDLGSSSGFAEDEFIGRRLRIGSKSVISILERDPRCKMISIDPDTAEQNPEVLQKVSRAHDGKAGIYGAVLVEGKVRSGDPIQLLD